MISVCMATYNGERFIQSQLDSILNQSQKPDEVVICDDNSTDNTVEIITRFIKDNKLENIWHVYVNDTNKGYPGNFYYASSLCSGDILFFADQDDIWVLDKIEKMIMSFNENRNMELLACNHGIIDEFGNILNTVISPKVKAHKSTRLLTVNELVKKFELPGMAMAIRKEYFSSILEKYCIESIPHDFALGIISADQNKFGFLDYIGVYHRRHNNNAAKEQHQVKHLIKVQRKLEAMKIYNKMLNDIIEYNILSHSGLEQVRKKLLASELRYNYIVDRNLFKIASLYLSNTDVLRLKSFVSDFLSLLIKDTEV